MALLKFLKGNYSSLNSKAIAEGQILICGDTGEMFVDVAADKRVKIGDFIVIDTLANLEALDASAVPTSRLYYVEDGNILARSNGTKWVQINKQPTADQIKSMIGLADYETKSDAADKLAEAKEYTDGKIGVLGSDSEGNAYADVKAYVDAKTSGIATDAALGELQEKVEAAEGEIDALQAAIAEDGSVTLAIADAKKAGTDAQAAAEAADAKAVKAQEEVDALEGVVSDYKTANDAVIAAIKDHESVDSFADVMAEIAKKQDIIPAETYDSFGAAAQALADAKEYVDGKDEAMDVRVDALEAKFGEGENTVDAQITAIADSIAAEKERAEGIEGGLQSAIDAINNAETGILKQAKDYADGKDEAIEAAQAKVDELEGTHATDKKALEDAIALKADQTAVNAIVADYLKAADKTELEGKITAEADARVAADNALDERLVEVEAFFKLAEGEALDTALDTLVEIQKYLDTEGTAADQMVLDIAANAKAISDHEALAAQTYETKEDATAKYDELTEYINSDALQADWNETNEGSAAFIKNKPELGEVQEYVLANWYISEDELTKREDGFDEYITDGYVKEWENGSLIIQGEEYYVNIDGQGYNVVCDRDYYLKLGNMSNELPFRFFQDGSGKVQLAFKESGGHSVYVSISGFVLYDEVISSNIARMGDLYSYGSTIYDEIDRLDGRISANEEAIAALQGADESIGIRIDAIEAQLGDGEGSVADMIADAKQEAIDSAVATAAQDAANKDAVVLAEAQKGIDANAAAVAANEEAIAKNAEDIAKKANSADVYAKAETYTQEEVNAAIEAALTAANSWGEF